MVAQESLPAVSGYSSLPWKGLLIRSASPINQVVRRLADAESTGPSCRVTVRSRNNARKEGVLRSSATHVRRAGCANLLELHESSSHG